METQEQYRTSNIRWASIDPSKSTSGVVLWNGPDLTQVFTMRPYGASGKYKVGDDIYPDKLGAWRFALMGVEKVVMESGKGHFVAVAAAQGYMQGFIECCCMLRGIPSPMLIDPSEWRRIIREQFGVSFPSDRKRCKILSMKLAKQFFNFEAANDDESDAILIGYAAQRAGMV